MNSKRLSPSLLPFALCIAMLLGNALSAPSWAQSNDSKRAVMRERFIERQHERQEQRQQQFQRQGQQQQWQQRQQEQRQMLRQQDAAPSPPPDGLDNRPGPGRLTPEQRQALRRQIQEAGRLVYPAPRP